METLFATPCIRALMDSASDTTSVATLSSFVHVCNQSQIAD